MAGLLHASLRKKKRHASNQQISNSQDRKKYRNIIKPNEPTLQSNIRGGSKDIPEQNETDKQNQNDRDATRLSIVKMHAG